MAYHTKTSGRLAGMALAIGAALLFVPQAVADDPESETDVFAIARGGQYYDKWWAVIDADEPEGTNPAYPVSGKREGSTTWRCKECHGWDYKGKDGAYGSGSHFTGIKGIDGMAGADLAAVAAAIRAVPHDNFAGTLSSRAIDRLALFVSQGQFDMSVHIDPASKAAKGDPSRGARFFQTVCANCHGFDGKELNFGSADDPEYVGTVAKDNPWETLHKIRFGQPGQVMPALVVLDIQDAVDILAYSQTLPAK